MKMIYAIIHSEDRDNVTRELIQNKYTVTTLATTGGLFKKGNTTLLIGTEDEYVDDAIRIIEDKCRERKQVIYNSACATGVLVSPNVMPPIVPVTVDTGGATVFVVDVERFEKI